MHACPRRRWPGPYLAGERNASRVWAAGHAARGACQAQRQRNGVQQAASPGAPPVIWSLVALHVSVPACSRAGRWGETDSGCRALRACKPGMLAERAAHDQVVLGDTAGHLRVWKPAAAAEGGGHTKRRPLFTQACIWRAHERAVTSVQHVTMAGGLLLTASLARIAMLIVCPQGHSSPLLRT